VAGLLVDGAAGVEQGDLAVGLVLDGPGERAERVQILDLTPRAHHLVARRANRDVGVDAHRALLHPAVGGPGRHQHGAQLGHVGPCLGGGADFGLAHDLDERDAGAVVVDQ